MEVLCNHFSELTVAKKAFLLNDMEVCKYIYFVVKGCIRHFHVKEGEEITCDISLENTFITEFNSFNSGENSQIAFQALEHSEVLKIDKEKLHALYSSNPKYEELGRKVTEKVVTRTSNIAMSLASDKPETRYKKLMEEKPEIFLRVQQKYIANILGVKAESLSRIRKRVLEDLKS